MKQMKQEFLLLNVWLTEKIVLLLTALSIVALYSCTQTTAPRIDNPHGLFNGSIVMYDSTGDNPVNGKLLLARGDSTDLSGNWSLQGGRSGRLTGVMCDSTINVNLNPDFVDANTILIGTFDGTAIRGRWYFSGIAGVMNYGTFVAISD